MKPEKNKHPEKSCCYWRWFIWNKRRGKHKEAS